MNPKNIIDKSWYPIVGNLYKQPLIELLNEILPNISFQPSKEDIFKVFSMPVNKIKVVILGQEPYPTPGKSIGYSFATTSERKIPKTLGIISNEILREKVPLKVLDEYPNQFHTLQHWVEQGIFLLNTALTVETANSGSHLKYWSEWTKQVISYVSSQNPCIWILWGEKAQSFIPYINTNPFHVNGYDKYTIENIPANSDYNYILTAPHPAVELSSNNITSFYGCNHFLFVNKILSLNKKGEINY
jgi:uracil-DNA glycosylase